MTYRRRTPTLYTPTALAERRFFFEEWGVTEGGLKKLEKRGKEKKKLERM